MVDRLQEHCRACHVHVAEYLGIRRERARADAQDEAATQQMVEHGDIASDGGWMMIGHVDSAGAEFDAFGGIYKGR